jgi:hypothetical protein
MIVKKNFLTKLNGYDVELIEEKGVLYFFCNGAYEKYMDFKEDLAALNIIKDNQHPFESSVYDCFGMLVNSMDLLNLYEEIT